MAGTDVASCASGKKQLSIHILSVYGFESKISNREVELRFESVNERRIYKGGVSLAQWAGRMLTWQPLSGSNFSVTWRLASGRCHT